MDTKPDEVQEVQVPSEHVAVVAMFADRDEAENAVDALVERGFTDDQISLVARGAATDETVPEPDANKLSLDLGIAVCSCVWLAVAVSLGRDSRRHRFAGCGCAERESRSRSGAT